MQIRSGMLNNDQIKVLVKKYLHSVKERCENIRSFHPGIDF